LDDTEWNLLNKGLAKYYTHIVFIFESKKAYSYVLDFARLGIQFAQSKRHEDRVLRTELYSRLFNAAVIMSRFDVAQTAMIMMEDEALLQACLRKLVERMCETYHSIKLAGLPFPGVVDDVDRILEEKCKATIDVVNGIPYHQILYSWRIRHQKHQPAAMVLYDRIQKLKHAGEDDNFTGEYVLDSAVTREYLLCINALMVLPKDDRWILPDEFPQSRKGVSSEVREHFARSRDLVQTLGDGAELPPSLLEPCSDEQNDEPKRKRLTIDDIRKEYHQELERIKAIQNNQFGFEADDMDIL
jgi:nuclear pore complex protein Nup160